MSVFAQTPGRKAYWKIFGEQDTITRNCIEVSIIQCCGLPVRGCARSHHEWGRRWGPYHNPLLSHHTPYASAIQLSISSCVSRCQDVFSTALNVMLFLR